MKKNYVTPEVEYINFYSEEFITADASVTYGDQEGVGDDYWNDNSGN